jgi:hypothetical protein
LAQWAWSGSQCSAPTCATQAAIAGAVAGADAVVNAVSAYVETGGVTFEAVHEQGAKTLARGGDRCRCSAIRARLRHRRRSSIRFSVYPCARMRRTGGAARVSPVRPSSARVPCSVPATPSSARSPSSPGGFRCCR